MRQYNTAEQKKLAAIRGIAMNITKSIKTPDEYIKIKAEAKKIARFEEITIIIGYWHTHRYNLSDRHRRCK